MNVAILGTGYVGLTTGACLAYLGHQVTCVDPDANKIGALQRGEVPFHEPHLEDLLVAARPNLKFTMDYSEAIPDAQVVFIAVGTPPGVGGAPDLRYLQAAAEGVGDGGRDAAGPPGRPDRHPRRAPARPAPGRGSVLDTRPARRLGRGAGRRIRRDRDNPVVAVRSPSRLHHVRLCWKRWQSRRGPAALHVDEHTRRLGHRGVANVFHHQRKAGTGCDGHRHP